MTRRIVRATTASLDWLGERVVLFRCGDWVFVSFGLFATVGAWLSTSLLGFLLIGQGVTPAQFLNLALLGCVAVVVGSWLLARFLELRTPAAAGTALPPRPAFVSWGGILALVSVLALFGALTGHGALLVLDAAARTVFVGHAVGRLGCLSYGCCFGRPTRCRLAITYHTPQAKAVRVGGQQGVPLHPAPLYEALLDIALFVAVNAAALAGAPLGAPTALALIGYGAGRFGIEFLRENDVRVLGGRIALNQLVALALVVLGAALAVSLLLGDPGAAAPFAWKPPLHAVPWLSTGTLPGVFTVFVGFSLHRGEVGSW